MSTPLVKNSTYEIVETIDTPSICKLYQENFGTDVSRFFKGIPQVEIRRCKTSNYRYYFPLNLEGDAQFYDALSQSTPYYSKRVWQYNQAQQVIKKGDKVLDIGCGSGIFLEGLKSTTTQLFGLEFNPQAIEACRQKNIEIHSGDLKDLSETYAEQFDVITYFQVLEHIADVHSFVENSIKLLKPKGKLVIAVPNNNPYLYKYDKMHTLNLPPHHLGLWDKTALSYFPNIFDLSIVDISVEPLDNFSHWTKIQFREKLGFYPLPNFKIINTALNRFGKTINSKIAGRNIVAIYEKK